MKKLLAAIALLLPLIAHADSGFYNGSDLIEWMDSNKRVTAGPQNEIRSNDYQKSAMLSGFVVGVASAKHNQTICLLPGIKVLQIIGIVEKFTRDNPKYWNYDAAEIAEVAIMKDFPCKK